MSTELGNTAVRNPIQAHHLSMIFIKLLFTCIALSGCGLISQKSLYEGIRSQEKIKPDTLKPNPLEMPPYDQYQIERDKLKSPSSINSSN
jgi:hypothetical protein